MSACMSLDLHLRVIRDGAVLDALMKPEEVTQPIFRLPHRHVGHVFVTDIEDSAIAVDFSTRRDKSIVAGTERTVVGVGAGDRGVGAGGGGGGAKRDCEGEGAQKREHRKWKRGFHGGDW